MIQLHRTLTTFFALSWIVVKVVCFAPPPLQSPLTVRDKIARSTSSRWQSNHLSMSTDKLCGDPPFLAVLTEPDACVSVGRIEQTVNSIERATIDGGVTLVVVRINDDVDGDGTSENKWNLLKRLSELKQQRLAEGNRDFLLVVNNDVELVLRAISSNIRVDGVHVKEYNAHLIPDIRQKLQDALEKTTASSSNEIKQPQDIIIGTSCHSKQSEYLKNLQSYLQLVALMNKIAMSH